MEIVVEAFTPMTATINLHHEVTPHVIEVARRILTPPPDVAPYFGLKRSSVFHDTHVGVRREVEWETREAAAAVRKPCRVCRP